MVETEQDVLKSPGLSLWNKAVVAVLVIFLICGTAFSYWQLYRLEKRQYELLPTQGAELLALLITAFRQVHAESLVDSNQHQGPHDRPGHQSAGYSALLPATLALKAGERLSEHRPGAYIRLYSDYPFPWRKDGGPRDAFEWEALHALRQNPDQPFYRFEEFQGRPSLRYAVAERMQAACVSCHNSHPDSPKRDWSVGDVRGVVEIIRPFDGAVAQNRASLYRSALVCLGMSGLGIVGLVLVNRQRTVSAKAAMESEQKLRLILESAGDGIVIVDEQRRIVLVNRQAERMFGYPRAELLGKEVETLIPERFRQGHREHFARYLRNPTPQLMDSRERPLYGLRKDGSEFPVAISLNSVPLAKRMLICAIVRDVTERRHYEQALRAAYQENAQLIDAMPCILIGLDNAQCIRKWNKVAERTFGRPATDVLGQPLREAGIGFLDDAIFKGLETCHRQQRPVEIENVSYRRLDGTVGQLRVSLAVLNSQEMNSSGILVVAEDVSERRQLEAQLAQAQKMESIGQLAAGVAHEINTPIQYIGDNATFLRDAFPSLDQLLAQYERLIAALRTNSLTPQMLEQAEALFAQADLPYLRAEIPQAIEQILQGVSNVARIVRALKEFSHPATEEKTAVDINRSIECTVTVARNEWKYVADVMTELDPSLPPVLCLPGEINQVLLNVIVNAAHAVAERVATGEINRGIIKISTSRANGYVRISISDNGCGIPEKIRSRIFEPFFTTKPVGKGSGQGLAIAHAIVVKKHGGQITFESEVGKGTTFHILLPLDETLDSGEGIETANSICG